MLLDKWGNMKEESEHDTGEHKNSPLMSIGLTIIAVLLVPVLMYSMSPEGPIKEGHVVFSTGQYRAKFEDETKYLAFGYQGYCVVQPREQFLVIVPAATRSDGTVLVQKIGMVKREFPSCPSQTMVILHGKQITLKPDMWGGLRDSFTRVWSAE